MQHVIIRLSLSRDRVMEHYRGQAHRVQTMSVDGRTVEFPATLLRQFVSEEGVHGVFEICFDANNKLVSMRRMDPSAQVDEMA
jgi:uncharacterized protein YqjF (DUF2071 family)